MASDDQLPESSDEALSSCEDKLFLLSVSEVERFLGDSVARVVRPTPWAISRGAWTDDSARGRVWSGADWWWLRSRGVRHACAVIVTTCGEFFGGADVKSARGAVRPAIRVRLD